MGSREGKATNAGVPAARRAGAAAADGSSGPWSAKATCPGPGGPRRKSSLWRSRWFRTGLAVVGLLGVGAGASHALWPPHVVQVNEVATPEVPTSGKPDAAEPVVVPDVTGLSEKVARRALGDVGVTAAVRIAHQPAAGPVGLVVNQDPLAGSTAGTDPVTLTLAKQTSMPDLRGQQAQDGQDALAKLGATVLVDRVVKPSVKVGTILASAPAAGQPVPARVELRVADPGVALGLQEVEQVDSSSCGDASDVSINGDRQPYALSCAPRDEAAYAVYLPRRHAQVFQATVGVDDAGEQGAAQISVFGDGKTLATTTVAYGQARRLTVPIEGVLRLRLQVAPSTAEAHPTVLFGSPVLLGKQTDLDQARTAP